MARYLLLDIWLIILEYFNLSRDRATLLRVCHSWKDSFEKYVHKTVSIQSGASILKLTEAVYMQVHLGKKITKLELRGFSPYFANSEFHEDIQYYKKALLQVYEERYGEKPARRWRYDLGAGEICAWLGLLLPAMENLQCLTIVSGRGSITNLGRIVGNLGGDYALRPPCPLLLKLEKLDILLTGYAFLRVLRDLIPFFRLPSLRSLKARQVVNFGDQDMGDEQLEIGERISAIEEIVLENSNSVTQVAAMIKTCRRLRRFEYQHTDTFNAWLPVGERIYRPRAFHGPLTNHKESLEVLRLNDMGGSCDEWSPWNPDIEGEENDGLEHVLFGDLRDFTSLKELRMPVEDLLTMDNSGVFQGPALHEILPEQLVTLFLTKTAPRNLHIVARELEVLVKEHHREFWALKIIWVQLARGYRLCEIDQLPKFFETSKSSTSVSEEQRFNVCLTEDGDYHIPW